MQLETLVQQNYDRMGTSDHMIWQYISHHRQECRTMSLHQLADACQVSHTTVLRFIQMLGMEGFSEFKVFLKWQEQQKRTIDAYTVERNCFDLTRTISLIEQMDCTKLFEAMDRAHHVYAYGSGSAQKAAARMLKNCLIVEEKLLHVIEGREEREMALRTMQPGDVAFLYSVSGNNPQMNEYAAQMREKGMVLVAICQDGANALAKLCAFQLPFYTQKFDIGQYAIPYHSSAGMFAISEILSLKYAVYLEEKECN